MSGRSGRSGPKRSAEPFIWLGFSAGGVVAALAIPALLFLFGLAFPLGWIDPPDHAHLDAVVTHAVTRLALLGLCVLSLIHFAHRFRFTLIDGLQLRRYDQLIAAGTYGTALVGSVLAGYVLFFAI
ncbi:MAG: fumarate reductase subunit D [Micromonosporaceae bacterium]|nr:fumarate reductase subunit D [Micromonosporaceae bacterium]